jgi:protoheme IX farnesyltransferase
MLLAAGGLPPLHVLFLTLVGGALGAGGANAINCWFDRDIDSVMSRTASRAIPSGAVAPWQALAFGLLLGACSFLLLAVFVNVLAAALTLAALAFYVLVYTLWLKRSSEHNIVIGGAAGAVPPLVGWAAVTGEVSVLALALFAIIFLWTPPHFWALSLLMKGEYADARVPMLPVVRGEDETRRQILFYSIAMVAFTLVVTSFGLGSFYFVVALGLGGCFLAFALRLIREATNAAARRLFRYSILYLALLFTAMVVDRLGCCALSFSPS